MTRALAIAAAMATALLLAQSPAHDFIPDSTFAGSNLAQWHAIGQAEWKAQSGAITATPKSSGGGWLFTNASWQDVEFYARFRCIGDCRSGILLRAETTNGVTRGVFLSLAPGDLNAYSLTIDSAGREISREKLPNVGFFIRIAQPGGDGRGRAGTPGRAGAAGRGAPAGRGPGRGAPPMTIPGLMPVEPGIRANDWNEVQLTIDANILRPTLNYSNEITATNTNDDSNGYGQIGIYAGGTGTLEFQKVSFKDLGVHYLEPEKFSSRFRVQRIDDFYYSWGAAVADINHDGVADVIAGPYYYLGPDYTRRREIFLAQAHSPGTQFANNWFNFAFDFNGDGWPDVLGQRPLRLFVNPKGENRRWDSFPIIPVMQSELALMRDIDGDGRPEVIFGANGLICYARYDPAHPTETWKVHTVSDPGYAYAHGFGVGDINGDGRMDILQTAGWWEQPKDLSQEPWKYHVQAFGRWGRSEGAGGSEMEVYDVNGDGLNDVVTGLNAHGWGLAWYEQKRDKSGNISFVQHMIIDDFSTKNAGNVVINEMHAAAMADIDGDGIPDFITGKRYFSHLDSFTDADPYGPAVLYWFRTVRNPKAPGGAEFVPELIHNRSGVGAQFTVGDLNKDGAVDIVTSTDRGTFIFWGRKGSRQ